MQRYTMFFIIVKLYMFRAVSSPIIRSSRTVNTASGMCQDSTSSHMEAMIASMWAEVLSWYIPDAVCAVIEILMMGGETVRNM